MSRIGVLIGYETESSNSIYLEIERTSGGSFKQTWAVKGGWGTVFYKG